MAELLHILLTHELGGAGGADGAGNGGLILRDAADFVRMVEKRQGIKISAPEEIAFKYGWIYRETLLESASRYGKSPYGQHLKNVADGKLRY